MHRADERLAHTHNTLFDRVKFSNNHGAPKNYFRTERVQLQSSTLWKDGVDHLNDTKPWLQNRRAPGIACTLRYSQPLVNADTYVVRRCTAHSI